LSKIHTIWAIWVKYDSVWAKIKILHPQKHSISYTAMNHNLRAFTL